MIESTMAFQEERIIDMMERIENYILGKLIQEEIDELWMEFLREPEWLGYLEIELLLRKVNVN